MRTKLALLLAMMALPSAAIGACPAGLVCASDPATVVAAMTDAGFRAKLGKDNEGDPTIESAASGFNFDVLFYGCTAGKDCASLQFRSGFTGEKHYTPALVNEWNVAKRFAQLSVRPDTSLQLNYDVTTEGGLTKANFADAIDWWQVMLGELAKFLNERKPK